ncbi:S8 family peptidase [Streptomyces zagrosensis]|uniref:Subtilisin family serine protease n=1 Tax=Streptomyces zagrosensis TaxID=1042984 RepID=A0A7W9UY26_9ACTN|nr:S8 family peptidase [Streptomyces zagrosensis]MBB5934936.1 subtilisin family serine protease [Streptomyces zagrosensis]
MQRRSARVRRLATTGALVTATVTAMLAGAAVTAPAQAAGPPQGRILAADSPHRVDGSYVVTLKNTPSVAATATSLADTYGGEVTRTYSTALKGFALRADEESARRLAADPAVLQVEADQRMRALGTQPNPPSWGLDRVDQEELPLDKSYTYPDTSQGVTTYVIDTGIRVTHEDFGGRASWGTNTVDSENRDCNGHGTHVAGTMVGDDFGLAKKAKVVAVKVLDCEGSGTTAGVIKGIDWVTANAAKPAVANMSLGGGKSETLDRAVTNSINAGIPYAVAAGNENEDACTGSPSGAPAAITVGSTTRSDGRSSFSDYGSCLDIFAPGSDITSAWMTDDTATSTISGTSMASPHAAGAAALVHGAHPNWSPQQVRDALVQRATSGVVTDPRPGSPNKLLRVTGEDIPTPDNDFALATGPASGTVEAGQEIGTKVTTSVVKGDPENITLTASGLPNGAEARFDPASVQTGQSAGLAISTSANTPSGTYQVAVKGTSPSASHTATYTLTVTGGDTGCEPGQKLANPGFESGATGWQATADVIGQWREQPARTGSYNAWLNGRGRTATDNARQNVTLPANCSQYALNYHLHIDSDESPTRAWDTLKVQVLDAGGSSVLATLKTHSNQQENSGYARQTVDLSAYAGREVQLRFLGQEDASVQTSFVLDDVTVDVS